MHGGPPGPDAPGDGAAGSRWRIPLWPALAVALAVSGVGLLAVAWFEDWRAERVRVPTAAIPGEVGAGPGDVAPDAARPEVADGFGEVRVAVGGDCLDLLLADTPTRRNQGLRGVTEAELGAYDGMLFARREPAQTAFTMAGTEMDLSIAWYDGTGAFLGRAEMVVCPGSDETCPLYPSPAPWSFAVETPAGQLPEGDLGDCGPRG